MPPSTPNGSLDLQQKTNTRRFLAILSILASAGLGGCSSPGAIDENERPRGKDARANWRQVLTPHQGDPWLFGVSPSFLPNLGLTGTIAREVGVWRGGGVAVEAEFTQQFIDDTSFTDSENPEAGDWSQGKLGARWAYPFDPGRWATLRTGGVWFNARGKPNIINDPGNYLGVYVEFGLEARLTENLIVGPAITAMLAYDGVNRDEHVIPQVTWRFLYTP
ncbi:MAG: hypothetical protein ACI8QS_000629 [Planctomycetota bacterium]